MKIIGKTMICFRLHVDYLFTNVSFFLHLSFADSGDTYVRVCTMYNGYGHTRWYALPYWRFDANRRLPTKTPPYYKSLISSRSGDLFYKYIRKYNLLFTSSSLCCLLAGRKDDCFVCVSKKCVWFLPSHFSEYFWWLQVEATIIIIQIVQKWRKVKCRLCDSARKP